MDENGVLKILERALPIPERGVDPPHLVEQDGFVLRLLERLLPAASPPPPPIEENRPVPLLGGGPLLALSLPVAAAAGVEVFGGLRWPHVSLTLEARGVLPGTGDNQPQRIKPVSVAALVGPCGHLGLFFGCGLLEGGALVPTGPDAPVPPRVLGVLGVGLRAGVEGHPARHLVLRAHADIFGTLSHELVRSSPSDWNVPEVVALFGIDLAVLLSASLPESLPVPLTSSTP